MTPIRVMYDIHPRTVGGTEQFLTRLLPRLAARRISPVVVSARMGAPLRAVRARGVAVVPVAGMHTERGVERLADLIRRRRVQLVQSNYYSPHLALAAGAAGVPHIWRLGGHIAYASGISNRTDRASALRMIQMLSAAVVCNSRFVRRQFPAAARARIGVIHNGVESARVSAPRSAAPILVGMAAHFTPQKRHEDFLRAAMTVSRARADVAFVIFGETYQHAGSGQYAARMRALAAPLLAAKRLSFSRFDPLDKTALARCAVIVQPSIGESLSNAVLEAMAAGVPVVAAKSGGTPEILTRESGVLVPARDSDAIARALLSLLDRPARRRRVGRAAARRAGTVFSMATCVDRYTALYAKTLR